MDPITFTVSVGDVENLVEHELRTTYRRRILGQSAAGALGMLVLVYAFLYSQLHHHVAAGAVALFVSLLVLYALPGVTRDQQRKTTRRIYSKDGGSTLGPRTLTLEPEHLLVTSAYGEGRMKWAGFRRLATT